MAPSPKRTIMDDLAIRVVTPVEQYEIWKSNHIFDLEKMLKFQPCFCIPNTHVDLCNVS